MYVKVEDVIGMSEVEDAIVMGNVIVAKCGDDKFYYAKQDQPRFDEVELVPFYPAKEWQVKRFRQMEGKGHGDENAQLEDAMIAKMAQVEIEESVTTPWEYYEPRERFGMEGAFEDPFELRGVSL